MLLAPVLLALALPASASAKDLNGRFGVGAEQASSGLSTLSFRIGFPTGKPTTNIGLGIDAGIDTLSSTGTTDYFGGARLYFGVVAEDNMNLYLGVAAGYASTDGVSAIRVGPNLGAEFFLFGLENLGFLAELQLNVDIGGSLRISTFGAPAIGFHYYF